MANRITYQVGFDLNKQGLDQLKSSLQEIYKLKVSDVMKINDMDRESAKKALGEIRQQAGKVETALEKAFNAKLNTINIQTFKKSLHDAGSSIEQVYKKFSQAGYSGEDAFRGMINQLTNINTKLKESHTWLDRMGTTLANTIKWNVASSAINTLTNSVQQAWGFVKNLDTSLNDIRIVTGKSSEEMANFAIQANEAAQSLGRTTVDYTNAALIYAQQGLNDEQIEKRTEITLKTANVTGQSTDAVSEELTAV